MAPSSPSPARRLLPRTVFTRITRYVDPLAARRGATLVQRRLHGTGAEPGSRSAIAADEIRDAVVTGMIRGLRQGTLDDDGRALLDDLVDARLQEASRAGMLGGRLTRSVSRAFESSYRPQQQPAPPPAPEVERAIVDSFQRLYYHVSPRTWKDTTYRGVTAYKCPTDMWVYAELVHRLRPGLVVETGTFRGGSALFLADACETIGHGRVVTIDIDVQPDRPQHPRLTYLTGSSVADDVLTQVRGMLPDDGSAVMVILDSDHSQAHVAAELAAYAPIVTTGSYLIVEDTNVNGHPVAPNHGPGPWEATEAFLSTNPGYMIDHRSERYGLTQNPSGYLVRTT